MLCPLCKEEIQDGAIKCKHCGSDLSEKPNQAINKTKPEVDYGLFLIITPIIAVVLMFFWVGSMNLLQNPGSKLTGLLIVTILGTAVIAAMEASKLGMKSDKKGNYSPTEWFFLITLLWIIGYPAYLSKRSNYGRSKRLKAGISVAIVFILTYLMVNAQIEDSIAKFTGAFK